MTERTVLDLYHHEVAAPRAEHYAHWTAEGRRVLSTERFFDSTAGLANSLSDLGIRPGDRMMLLSENRPEWHMVDLATLSLGAVDVPIYGTLTAEQIAYQARDSGAKVAVVDTAEQMEKLHRVKRTCPGLEHLVQIEGQATTGALALADLLDNGRHSDHEAAFWDRAARVDPGDLMTIIYTSGTTGEPKGVMLTRDNVVQNAVHSAGRAPLRQEDLALEFLPLCHADERTFSYVYMWKGVSKAYCSPHHVGDLLADIAPTLFFGVPRFFEKVMAKITDKVAAAPVIKRALFEWALATGAAVSRRRIAEHHVGGLLTVRHSLADTLVLSRVRAALGGRLRFCMSGGAALPLHVNEFFHALGVFIIEGYGLTETSPIVTANGIGVGGDTARDDRQASGQPRHQARHRRRASGQGAERHVRLLEQAGRDRRGLHR